MTSPYLWPGVWVERGRWHWWRWHWVMCDACPAMGFRFRRPAEDYATSHFRLHHDPVYRAATGTRRVPGEWRR